MNARRVATLGTGLLLLVLQAAGTAAWAAEVTAQTGFGFDGWWRRGGGGRATQIQVPVSVDLRAGDFSAGLLTAYVYTQRPDDPEVVLSSLVDTKLTTSYEIAGKLPVDVLFGLDFNLPTGKKNLTPDEMLLQMNEDLLPITNFGEGLDVNPTLTVARSWGPVAAGLGVGYLWRGSYVRSGELDVDDYNPSEVVNLSGELRWAFGSAWETRLLGNYARYGREQVNGKDLIREGDFYALLLGLRRSGERWTTSLSLQGILRKPDKVRNWDGALDTEMETSRGRQWRAVASTEGKVSESVRVTGTLQGFYVAENAYPSWHYLHTGKKRKVFATVGLAKRLATLWEARFEVGGFYMDIGETHYPLYEEASRYLGASARATLTASF